MIRGVDAQVMTNRAAEYSKDVSAMLRRDEVANDFANRLNRLNTEQETKTVTQMEKAAQGRINADDERGRGQGGGEENQQEEQGASAEEKDLVRRSRNLGADLRQRQRRLAHQRQGGDIQFLFAISVCAPHLPGGIDRFHEACTRPFP